MGGKHNQGQVKQCLNCGKDEYVAPYRLKTHKFCSRSCASQWKSKNETVEKSCNICHSLFHVIYHRAKSAKYCSNECRYIGMKGRGLTPYKCQHCHKEFLDSASTKRKFCSRECVNKSSKETFKPVFSTVRKMMIARNMVEKCIRCGFNEFKQILGIHHKDRNRHNNDLSNLEVLCPNCHSIEHMKHTPHGFTE